MTHRTRRTDRTLRSHRTRHGGRPHRTPGRFVERHHGAREAGSVALIVLFMIGVIMLVTAIVFDDGSALSDRQRASDVASQAARAGADAIVPTNDTSAVPVLDPTRAQQAADAYLNSAGVTGTATATPTRVTVTVTIVYRTKLLSMIGYTTITVHGTATAQPVAGLVTVAG